VNFYTSIFNKKIKFKKSVFYIFIIFFIVMNSVAFINYLVNPMWAFDSPKFSSLKQLDFDERQQKTNYLYFINNRYDNVILGSSRTTYLNQNRFDNLLGDTYNYACNAMSPYEFENFLEHFTKMTHHKPKNIILGLDFFGMNKKTNKLFSSKKYYKEIFSKFYRLKILYNLKVLQFSIKNIKELYKNKKAYYDSNQIKHIPFKRGVELENHIKATLKHFVPFKYDNDIVKYYEQLKYEYNKSNFIIFTPPITYQQLILNHNDNLDEYYFKWLRSLVKIFGKVYHFMYPSDFTKNINNFYNANHFHDISGDKISKDIVDGINGEVKFGIILNKDNIEDFISSYKKSFKD